MPDITISKLVEMSSFGEAAAAESLGTQGCGPCGGLITISGTGASMVKRCAHFSCSELKDATYISAQITSMLGKYFPLTSLTAVLYCTTAKGLTTDAIIGSIITYFANSVSPMFGKVDGAYVTAEGDLQTLESFGMVLKSETHIDNTLADVPKKSASKKLPAPKKKAPGPRPALPLKLPLTPAYSGEGVKLKKQNVGVVLDLTGGKRTCESEMIDVGTCQGAKIYARLTFEYEYDREKNLITLRGNDDRSTEQLRITTFLGGEERLASHHTPNDAGHNLTAGNVWSQQVLQSSRLGSALAGMARECNDELVQALKNEGVRAVRLRGTPPIVTAANLNDFKHMLREKVTKLASGKVPAEIARIQHILDSTYWGTWSWSNLQNFVNVLYSSDDPLPPPDPKSYTSWLDLWSTKCNEGKPCTRCTSFNYFEPADGSVCQTDDFVGGHVLEGTNPNTVKVGDDVLVFAICRRHNSKRECVRMCAQQAATGLWLKNYMRRG